MCIFILAADIYCGYRLNGPFFTYTSWPFLGSVLREASRKQAEVESGESRRMRENIVFSFPAQGQSRTGCVRILAILNNV